MVDFQGDLLFALDYMNELDAVIGDPIILGKWRLLKGLYFFTQEYDFDFLSSWFNDKVIVCCPDNEVCGLAYAALWLIAIKNDKKEAEDYRRDAQENGVIIQYRVKNYLVECDSDGVSTTSSFGSQESLPTEEGPSNGPVCTMYGLPTIPEENCDREGAGAGAGST